MCCVARNSLSINSFRFWFPVREWEPGTNRGAEIPGTIGNHWELGTVHLRKGLRMNALTLQTSYRERQLSTKNRGYKLQRHGEVVSH
jgi:hypothetical protein